MKTVVAVALVLGCASAYAQSNRVDVYNHDPVTIQQPNVLKSYIEGQQLAEQMRLQREQREMLEQQAMVQKQAAANEAADRRQQARESNEQTQVLISTIPELAAWQSGDPVRWRMAVAIDADLLKSPQYQVMPARERMLKVVEIVKSVPVDQPAK